MTTFTTKTVGYTAAASDAGAIHRCTSAITVALTAAGTLSSNWSLTIIADGANVVIDPNGAETIDGKTTLTVRNGSSVLILCDGANFRTDLRADPPAQKGHIHGLTLSNNSSDATNDIDIATGEAASDGTIPYLMGLTSGLTKRLDAAWAVGTGNGGLDTGAIANATYHVWLIQRSDTGVVDALFSLSATSPTMPSNYDRKRRIGSIIRESAAIVSFTQNNDYFRRAVNQSYGSTSARAAALLTLNVPAGIVVRPILVGVATTTTASTNFVNSMGDGDGSVTDIPIISMLTGAGDTSDRQTFISEGTFKTNTSREVMFEVVINSGAISSNTISTIGWIDDRGKTS